MIFKEENMQAQTPRKESTMARRFLETSQTTSQKGKNGHSSPTRKQSTNPHRSLSSPWSLNFLLIWKSLSLSLLDPQPSHSPNHHHHHGTPKLAPKMRLARLHQSGRGAPASKLNIETVKDSMVRKNLSLDNIGER